MENGPLHKHHMSVLCCDLMFVTRFVFFSTASILPDWAPHKQNKHLWHHRTHHKVWN